jgi:hypothetical protein
VRASEGEILPYERSPLWEGSLQVPRPFTFVEIRIPSDLQPPLKDFYSPFRRFVPSLMYRTSAEGLRGIDWARPSPGRPYALTTFILHSIISFYLLQIKTPCFHHSGHFLSILKFCTVSKP